MQSVCAVMRGPFIHSALHTFMFYTLGLLQKLCILCNLSRDLRSITLPILSPFPQIHNSQSFPDRLIRQSPRWKTRSKVSVLSCWDLLYAVLCIPSCCTCCRNYTYSVIRMSRDHYVVSHSQSSLHFRKSIIANPSVTG